MLAKLDYELSLFLLHATNNLSIILKILVIIWSINLINWRLFRSKLNLFGIWPRQPIGAIGIFFSCFLHKNFNHLLFNSIPLFALSLFIMTYGLIFYTIVSLIIIFLEGITTWLFARPGIHIGASGLITGYFGFILASAYIHPSITALFLAVLTLYYFGSIFLSLFPTEEKVSWESHLFGFLAGITTKLTLPYLTIDFY